jgi:hypothetical protein
MKMRHHIPSSKSRIVAAAAAAAWWKKPETLLHHVVEQKLSIHLILPSNRASDLTVCSTNDTKDGKCGSFGM